MSKKPKDSQETPHEKNLPPLTREDLKRLEDKIIEHNQQIAEELQLTDSDKQKISLEKKKIKSLPDKLEVVILRKINDTYVKVGNQKIKSTDVAFTFLHGDKRATFIVPKNLKVVYSDGKKSFIFYDFDSGLLDFDKTPFPITIEETDDIFTKNAIAGLFSRIKGSLEKPEIGSAILKYIVVAIASGAIGWIAHTATMPNAQMIGSVLIGLC